MDTERLHLDIKSHLRDNPTSTEHLDHQSHSDPKWTLNPDSLLLVFESPVVWTEKRLKPNQVGPFATGLSAAVAEGLG